MLSLANIETDPRPRGSPRMDDKPLEKRIQQLGRKGPEAHKKKRNRKPKGKRWSSWKVEPRYLNE